MLIQTQGRTLQAGDQVQLAGEYLTIRRIDEVAIGRFRLRLEGRAKARFIHGDSWFYARRDDSRLPK